jgi:hypothetical protein
LADLFKERAVDVEACILLMRDRDSGTEGRKDEVG